MNVLSERPPSRCEARRSAARPGYTLRVLVDVARICQQRVALVGRTQAIPDKRIQENAPPWLGPGLLVPIEVTLEPDLAMHGFADVNVQVHMIHQTGYRLEDAKDVGFAARPAYSCQIFHHALHRADRDAQADALRRRGRA